MVCTVAAIVALLGYMPPPGTVLTIPKEMAAQYSVTHQAKAQRCARKYGIELRVSE
jgi:hypothetical protein